jgi:hypothetical protein
MRIGVVKLVLDPIGLHYPPRRLGMHPPSLSETRLHEFHRTQNSRGQKPALGELDAQKLDPGSSSTASSSRLGIDKIRGGSTLTSLIIPDLEDAFWAHKVITKRFTL